MNTIASTIELRQIIRAAAKAHDVNSEFTSYTDKIENEPSLRRVAVWFPRDVSAIATKANADLAAKGFINKVTATKSGYIRSVATIAA